MNIAQWTLPNNVFVAPMAGVTDRPFRRLCKKLGAGYAVSEMAASNPALWESVKTARRLDHKGEVDPVAVQITGTDPQMMAQAAVFNIQKGAKIIDINMGCPAKKVCKVAAGSALLRHPDLIDRILTAVVQACRPYNVPVTLKTRTGWDAQSKNVLPIALRAQDIGIAALTLHGRTRCDFYTGQAEYDTIAQVKQALDIPVIANGDIDTPQKAQYVLKYTQADAVMIGRAAQGNPWIFKQTTHYLATGELLPPPSLTELRTLLLEHLHDHYQFYGEYMGVRTARKHLGWYLTRLQADGVHTLIQTLNQCNTTQSQLDALCHWFDSQPSL